MRVPRHIVDRRQARLCDLIRTDGFLPVAEICRKLGVSAATARRDLASVAASGHITRTRGGALADYNASFASLGERAGRARTAKGRIAAAALTRFPLRGTVFLDAGTTVRAIARQLLRARRDLTGLSIVTNSLPVATLLGGAPGLDLHVLGGTFLHRQAVLLGADAVRSLAAWKFDAAFLGGESMDADGISNSHAEIAVFQTAVLLRTTAPYFCLDAGKLGRTTPHRIGGWDTLGFLVTDASPAQLAAAEIPLPPTRLVLAK
ncbi:HTH-type transcriptional repressor GlcR [Lacunisphaera limnophila]|uniref:HTH-type transcriptional repressor GlcR n=1 Tax=Lacunisphaera limnophila TaxID=1838286 RepID=A0A1D8ATM9_9BACT|nr:DeoR/GlpR family DNA-binding transcription regulator [Lacunisphaera limnophila]AOS44255.1 HTH-type transcriptional repressor GlcR [Lacunisphaera limnophila]